MTVASAHRSPERVMRLLTEAGTRGVSVFIVVPAPRAHLGGVVAAHVTTGIGVPIDSSALTGSTRCCRRANAARRAVATVSIGKPGATNAGVLAAQILALGDTAIAERLEEYKRDWLRSGGSREETRRFLIPTQITCHEVLHRHVRVPCQSSRLLSTRGAVDWRRRHRVEHAGRRSGCREYRS